MRGILGSPGKHISCRGFSYLADTLERYVVGVDVLPGLLQSLLLLCALRNSRASVNDRLRHSSLHFLFGEIHKEFADLQEVELPIVL